MHPTPFSALADGPTLGVWLAEDQSRTEGLDPKTGCAFLAIRLAGAVGAEIGALALAGRPVPAIGPESVAVSGDMRRWSAGGQNGESRRYQLHWLTQDQLEREEEGVFPNLACALGRLFVPPVEGLARLGPFSPRGLWRLIADALADAMLLAGESLGDARAGMAFAQRILTDPRTPLANGLTGFREVSAPLEDGTSRARWFRVRAACCRYYLLPGGTLCDTCVLHPEEEQIRLLCEHLKANETPADATRTGIAGN
ncbi:(2Fe-2S)-binding protein [Cucumibacter marinus]|uniref:(2Fe-2S)-binding protein n=1 Tax=Cucumibacter marinus TaxID=1121252 RepID=UPI000424BACB|nr:(2Fe-2S)-binding protein [Cucumibacter marinus]